ncbi:exported hypothetical protein [Xanthomonas citri pv. fuscans]|nr:exported hypothetical protein [Xanthomonas citri pv. fuscans]
MAMRLRISGVASFMPWLWICASALGAWGSRGEALCARVPQERLGALLLILESSCFSDLNDSATFEFSEAVET